MAIDYKPEQNDYTNLTPFKIWLVNQINSWGVNNFPFLEGDFDKLTNYGMLMKMMKCLNDIINNQNLVEDDMSNIFNAFTELQNYINNYFDDLDVQEEINNKLDAMALDGSLSMLIGAYVDPIINNQNLRIDIIDNKVNSVVNYAPIPVNSTDDMTDTTKSYLLTTDGYWYYYNGSEWTRGGLYQATNETNTINNIESYLAHYEKDMTLQTNNKSIRADFDIPLYNGDIIDYYSVITQPSNNTIRSAVLYGYQNGSWVQLMNYGGKYNLTDIVLVNDNYEKLRFYYEWTNTDTTLTGNVKFNIIRANNFNNDIYEIMNSNGVIELHTNKIAQNGWIYEYTRPITAYKNFYIRFTDLDLINFDYLAIFGNVSGIYTALYSTRNTEITGSDLINKIIRLSSTTNLDGIRIYYHPVDASTTIYENNKFNLCIGENNVLSFLYNKTNELINKKFSICGVSIDTYEGYIPDGNVPYYNDTNLGSVNNTWWKKLINETGLKLIVNNSWTGSRATTSDGVEKSGVHRCLNLHTTNETPDIIFVGAFALNDWLYTELGNYQIGETLPDMNVDLTNSTNYNTWKDKTDKYEYAIATMFYRLQQKYPNAKIYAFDSYNYYRNGSYPTYYENKSISACNESLYKIAKIFGIEIIKLSECGITYINSRDLCVETGNIALHPNINGQELLFEEIIKYI